MISARSVQRSVSRLYLFVYSLISRPLQHCNAFVFLSAVCRRSLFAGDPFELRPSSRSRHGNDKALNRPSSSRNSRQILNDLYRSFCYFAFFLDIFNEFNKDVEKYLFKMSRRKDLIIFSPTQTRLDLLPGSSHHEEQLLLR